MFDSIIKPEPKIELETYSGKMEATLKKEIEQYVENSDFQYFNDFVIAACQFTLSKDKNWQKLKKELKNNSDRNNQAENQGENSQSNPPNNNPNI